MSFAISTLKIRINIFEFKKSHSSKWLTPQLKTFVLRKGTVQIGKKRVDSLFKRLIYISFIEIQVQIGLFLEISEAETFCRSKIRWNGAQRSATKITKMALPLMFSLIFCVSVHHRTKLKWQALWWNLVFIQVVFVS